MIRYDMLPTRCGNLLVAIDERGLVHVDFVAGLRPLPDMSDWRQDGEALTPFLAEFRDYFAGRLQRFTLPLAVFLLCSFVPFLGMAMGAAMGALMGHFADYGINDDFIKQVREKVTEGTSALFLLTANATIDKVAAAFEGTHMELIQSNLTQEQETALRAAFGEDAEAPAASGEEAEAPAA